MTVRFATSFLAQLTDWLRPRLKSEGITLIAIDGVDGAGKTSLADGWAAYLRENGQSVIRASVDGFHRPRQQRYRQGQFSPQGFFEDSYHYPALFAKLLTPLRQGQPCYTAVFDHLTDQAVSSPAIPYQAGCLLLFDGIFLHRPELAACWDWSLFLAVDFENSVPRGNQRFRSTEKSADPDPRHLSNRRYVEGQQIYLDTCQPQTKASLVIDYNDLSQPRFLPFTQ